MSDGQSSLLRPTDETSTHRPGFPFEWSPSKHVHLWIGLGDVAFQVQARLWRLTWGFTFWRSYAP